MSNNVYILGGCRSPNGNFKGQFGKMPIVQLMKPVVQTAVKRSGLPATEISEVIIGNVLAAGKGQNPAKQVANLAELPMAVPAFTLNQLCGSGLKAVQLGYNNILAGEAAVVLAGGMESMSQSEHSAYLRDGRRLGDMQLRDTMINDGLTDATHQCHMGLTGEEVAARCAVSREDQDAYALESQTKAAAAIVARHFDEEMVGIPCPMTDKIIDKDEPPKPNVTLESLRSLKPCFKNDGSITAGNASGCNDGAAAVVLAHSSVVSLHNLTPMARIVAFAEVSIDPMVMGISPIQAIRKLLDKVKWSVDDVDLYEINEPFAAQALAVVRELGLDAAKVNVSGGAIALGHPIGASGTRVLVTLMYALRRLGLKRGVCALCVGGGMGIACAIESCPQ